MGQQIYTPQSWVNIREAAENAIKMARATGKTIMIQMNDARFSVNADTQIQEAIDTYLEVKRKMFEAEKKLKQKSK